MRNSIKIGELEFKYKKDALEYYKKILNSYGFGDSLNDNDYNDLIDLLCFEENDEEYIEEEKVTDDESSPDITDIRVAKVQYGAKCFEIVWSDQETEYISYRLLITKPKHNPASYFNIACRNAIQEDLRLTKQQYFDLHSEKGFVKCQETSKLSKWENLVIDHRQPNTFSVIVDRFIELNDIDINKVDYVTSSGNLLLFKDEHLIEKFKNYHKKKATLRIVRKECNSGRAYQARIAPQKKDLNIPNKS